MILVDLARKLALGVKRDKYRHAWVTVDGSCMNPSTMSFVNILGHTIYSRWVTLPLDQINRYSFLNMKHILISFSHFQMLHDLLNPRPSPRKAVKKKRKPTATVTLADVESNAIPHDEVEMSLFQPSTPKRPLLEPTFLASPGRTRLDHAYASIVTGITIATQTDARITGFHVAPNKPLAHPFFLVMFFCGPTFADINLTADELQCE